MKYYNKKSKARRKFLSKFKKQIKETEGTKEIIIFKLCLIVIFIILYILPNKQTFHNRTEKITERKLLKPMMEEFSYVLHITMKQKWLIFIYGDYMIILINLYL